MAALRTLSSTSIAFCDSGDAPKADKAAIETLPHEIKRFWEVSNAEADSLLHRKEVDNAQGCGSKHNCERSNAEKKLSCDVHAGGDKPLGFVISHNFPVEDDAGADDWVSPRISFSRDFVLSEVVSLVESAPDTRKKAERDMKDNYSAEFAFSKDNPAQGVTDRVKGFMLSADELFFDGKLLPLPLQSIWAASNDPSVDLSSAQMHRQEEAEKSHTRPATRHLSFEIHQPPLSSASTRLSSSSPCHSDMSSPCSDAHNNRRSLSVSSSPSKPPLSLGMELSSPSMSLPPTSPGRSSPPSTVSMTSSSALPSSASTSSSSVMKCSAKLKDFFKPKNPSKESSSSQLARDVTSRRPPVASRSFWPFSRSNSAGVSKITAPPSLPCRSKSAHESHTCDTLSCKELDGIDGARLSTSSSAEGSKSRGTIPTTCKENFRSTVQLGVTSMAEDLNACNKQRNHCVETCVDTVESRTMVCNMKSRGVPGDLKVTGKRIVGATGTGNLGGRKGVSAAGVHGNGGKTVLRNLERCSAEKKLGRDGWRGLNRRGSFPVGARVSPVLNVGVCRGPSAPTIGFFRFNTSRFAKKEKHGEAAINWRNGS